MTKTWLTITLYFLPTAILSSVGILILVFQRAGFDIVFGVLVLILAVVLLTGGIVVQSMLRVQARQVKLQTDFVAKVSHELRTPLASIRMFVDTLQSGGQDPVETAMCLDVISSETSRLTTMIERLLSWGRMESGRRTYKRRPELVSTLVGEALAQAETQLQNTQIEIKLDIPEKSPAILADREAFVEALLNLISNAIKYGTIAGIGKICIRVWSSPRRAYIQVEDNGPGIEKREQRRIFEKFYRGSSQVAAQRPGSGLGLAMARLIIKAHRGKIWLTSQPGSGTIFTIEMPPLRPHDERLPLEVPVG